MVEDIRQSKNSDRQYGKARKTWFDRDTIFIFLAVCLLLILSFGVLLIYLEKDNYWEKMAFIIQRMTALERKVALLDKQQAKLLEGPAKPSPEKADLLPKGSLEKEEKAGKENNFLNNRFTAKRLQGKKWQSAGIRRDSGGLMKGAF